MEPGIYMLSETVRTLWMLGYPDQARRRSEETLPLDRTTPNHPSLAFALLFAAFLYLNLREPEKTRQNGGECIPICNEHGAAQERAWVTPIYGWALAKLAQVEERTPQIPAPRDPQLSRGLQPSPPPYLTL